MSTGSNNFVLVQKQIEPKVKLNYNSYNLLFAVFEKINNLKITNLVQRDWVQGAYGE